MCFDAIVISVGCEKDTSLTVTTDTLSKIITNVNNTLSTKIINSFTATQSNQVEIEEISKSTLNVQNFINAEVKYMTTIDDNVSNQISQQMIDDIQQKLDKETKDETELLSKALNGQSKTDIMTNIKKIVENNLSTSVVNQVINNTAVVQNNVLHIKKISESIVNISNDMFIKSVAETLAKNIINNSQIISLQNKIDENIKVVEESKSKGLNSIIDTIGDVLKSIGISWIIGFAIIAVVAILFLPMIVNALGGSSGVKEVIQAKQENKQVEGKYGRRRKY